MTNSAKISRGIATDPANYAIIVGGGSGTRMQSVVPKQFLLLCGRPVLMHTITAFYKSGSHPKLIVVLPADYHDYWRQLCSEYNFEIPHQLVNGGQSRFYSVKNGLALIKDNKAVVAVHDAVRPLVSKELIEESYKHAAENGNAIAAVKSRDSVRQYNTEGSKHLERDQIYLIQTPQTFKFSQLKEAYQQEEDKGFTDDAGIVEQSGEVIHLIEGDYRNFKITFPEDICIAESLLKREQ